MTSPSFPGALDVLANPGPTTLKNQAGYEIDVVIARLQNCVMAIEAKLGLGASAPASAGVLRWTGGTASVWGTVQNGDIGAGVIAASKLNAGGTPNTVLRTTDGATAAFGSLVTADIGANAISRVATAVGTTSEPASGSVTEIAVPQMNIALTGGVVGATAVLLFETMVRSSVAGDNMEFLAYRDGNFLTSRYVAAPVSGYNLQVVLVAAFTVPTASYGVSVNFHRLTGTGTVTCTSTLRSLTLIELKR